MGLFHALHRRWRAADRWAAVALDTAGGIPDLAGPLTYAELDHRARRAAGFLADHGVGPGDVVILQLPRSLAFLELYLGALALGAAALPLNEHATPAELRFYAADARPRLSVLAAPEAPGEEPSGWGVLLPAAGLRALLDAARALPLEALPEPDEDALATLLYTSGTTGRPKGAMISHRNIRATVQALHEAWRWSADDHILHALPLFHVHGLFAAQLGALWAGARCTWVDRFDAARVLDLLARLRCTVFMGVPTFYHRFLSLPAEAIPDLSGMRLFTCGSAALPAADMQAFFDRTGHAILERYGMTEVGLVLSNPYDGERRPGAVGFPVPGVRARVTHPVTGAEVPPGEVGEIRIAGDSVIRGYLGLPEQTAEALSDGWMHTGDLGRVDEDGYFHVVGRLKELVISGGFNVYPRELEAVLREVPGVAEAAVVGLPDPDLGERVVAALVPAPGQQIDLEAVIAHARQRLAPYKRPRELRVVAELPRNAMGKVQKHLLRDGWTATD